VRTSYRELIACVSHCRQPNVLDDSKRSKKFCRWRFTFFLTYFIHLPDITDTFLGLHEDAFSVSGYNDLWVCITSENMRRENNCGLIWSANSTVTLSCWRKPRRYSVKIAGLNKKHHDYRTGQPASVPRCFVTFGSSVEDTHINLAFVKPKTT